MVLDSIDPVSHNFLKLWITSPNFFENCEPFDVIYLDFAKAFDAVPHKRLLNKLKAYGITGNILHWIESFLTDRRQRVRIYTSFSKSTTVVSGLAY